MLLVIDANVLVGELLRVRGRELFEKGILRLHISEQALDEALHEMSRRTASLALALGGDEGRCGIWTNDGDFLGCGLPT